MPSNNLKYVEARKMMVQAAIDEISKVQNFNNFYQRSFYQIAKFGLQLDARKEKLFASDKLKGKEYRNQIVQVISRKVKIPASDTLYTTSGELFTLHNNSFLFVSDLKEQV